MSCPLNKSAITSVVQGQEVVVADYASLLREHVTLKVRLLDRMFFHAYVPKLQPVGQVCIFLRWQRKFKIRSSAAFGFCRTGMTIRSKSSDSVIGEELSRS